MKYTQAKPGRIFVLRLEDGEIIHEVIEAFAREQKLQAAGLIILGAADSGSDLVIGPLEDRTLPVTPMHHILEHAHEVTGTGTLFPDEHGNPVLHMHMALGRESKSVTGCIRSGVKVWRVMEAILYELLDAKAVRRTDPETNLQLLQPE